MTFYVRKYREAIRSDLVYPCFILVQDNWDDYHFKTTFSLDFYRSRNDRVVIGGVKVMDIRKEEETGSTVLPEMFESLEKDFCSLGSNLSFYQNLTAISQDVEVIKVLEALNDAALFPSIRESFEHTSAFQSSLLREREAKTALLLGRNIIEGYPIRDQLVFKFTTLMKDATDSHSVTFEFNRKKPLEFRISAIVGKNGTGKTQFLANLANALCSNENTQLPQFETGSFDTELGPPFTKIICLSYSLFDSFRRPKPSKRYSYVYCGIRDNKDEIDRSELKNRHVESLKLINRKRTNEIWYNSLSAFVDLSKLGYELSDWFYKIENIDEIARRKNVVNLSSGHSILVYTLTELIAHITENSLVVFDEPETYLHPNAIANLINVLNEIAVKFDSFFILSTHSPILIQQLSSKNVFVFEREGNTPSTRRLDIESFGENLTTITKHIFETNEVKDGYKKLLEELSKLLTYEEVESLFNGRLGLNASIFLSNLYK